MASAGTGANGQTPPPTARVAGWVLSVAVTLVAIVLPFIVFQESMHAWTLRQFQTQAGTLTIALLVATLLMGDLLLPVPSSLVSTMAGALLGFPAGFAASLVGMTLGCQLGYALGRWCGLPLAQRLISDQELARVSSQVSRRGIWTFAIMRPIPVLAEASAFWAGVMRVKPLRFSAVTLLANVGISGVHAATGAAVMPAEPVALVLSAAIALPAWALVWGFRRWRHAA